MANLILPAGYTSQPQVIAPLDKSNSLVSGMVPMMVCNGSTFCEASRNKPLIVGGTITRFPTPFGQTLDNGIGAGDIGVTDGILNTNACVDFWYGQWRDTGASGQYLYGDYNANGIALCASQSSVGGRCSFYDGTTQNDSGVSLTSGNYYLFVVVREANGGVHKVYRDGLLFITGANAGATGGKLAFGSLGQGFWSGGTLSTATRTLLFGRLYGRGWTPSEVARFSKNPWQIFKAPTRRIFADGGAAGATFFYNPMSGRGGTMAQPLVVH